MNIMGPLLYSSWSLSLVKCLANLDLRDAFLYCPYCAHDRINSKAGEGTLKVRKFLKHWTMNEYPSYFTIIACLLHDNFSIVYIGRNIIGMCKTSAQISNWYLQIVYRSTYILILMKNLLTKIWKVLIS